MKIKAALLVLPFLIPVLELSAQGHFSKWYFGDNADLDFSTSPPTSNGNSSMSTLEGCASIAGSSGDLFFYTDGLDIWNANHNIMQNGSGLLGDGSSTQSAVIVPVPGQDSSYYVFTADQGGYGGPNQGINYSVVDMTLQGGLGEVVTKNVTVMDDSATEKIVAIPRCDSSFWVVTHKFHTDEFYAYEVTSSGVGSPVVSQVGRPHILNSNYSNTIGYLKASPDRRKLGLGVYGGQTFAGVYDFDPTTGVVSNPVEIEYSVSDTMVDGPYGVSFSPNSQYFYVGVHLGSEALTAHNPIYQYDLSSNDSSLIVNSETEINPGGTHRLGALQIAPDNKIYVSNYGAGQLDIIHDPNNGGMACNFVDDDLMLPGNATAQGGLPNFVRAFKEQGADIGASTKTLCGPSDSITLNAPPGTDFTWSTGDSGSSITVTDTGSYWVSVTDSNSNCSNVKEDTITIDRFDKDLEMSDTSFCEDSTLTVSLDTSDVVWEFPNWSTGSSGYSTNIPSGGSYWVEAQRYQCLRVDTFQVQENQAPQARIQGDTLVCRKGGSSLSALPANASSYLWSTSSTGRSLEIEGGGTYWVRVERGGCWRTDTIDVKGEDCKPVLEMPNVFSPNGDDENDRVTPTRSRNIEEIRARIYNRWGQLLYSSNKKRIEWDGTDPSGDEVPEGTYFWELEYFAKDDSKGELTGSVELVR